MIQEEQIVSYWLKNGHLILLSYLWDMSGRKLRIILLDAFSSQKVSLLFKIFGIALSLYLAKFLLFLILIGEESLNIIACTCIYNFTIRR